MRSRSSSAAAGVGGVAAPAGAAAGHRVWSLEGILLMTGLAGVFVLGVMLSSHVHVMDPPHGPVTYERQLHSSHDAPRLKASWIEDYIKSREALMRLIATGQQQQDGEQLSGELQKLSLQDLIKKLMGHDIDSLKSSIEHPEPGIHAESLEAPVQKAPAARLRKRPTQAAPEKQAGEEPDDRTIVDTADGGGDGADSISPSTQVITLAPNLAQWRRNLQHTPLIIICHDRPQYLDRTLSAIFKHHPGDGLVPIVVSEDGSHQAMTDVVDRHRAVFQAKYPNLVFLHIHHKQDPGAPTGYHKLAQNYKWALQQAFDHLGELDSRVGQVDKVLILEEDLEIAPDFFNFFGALAPLLNRDKTLLAISAWNDNGMTNRVRDPKALYRSDFFPGLGWMMPRRIWEELEPKWPKGYWDDWLREPAQRKGRQVIRPEVCRTFHFGMEGGTSQSQYSDYLQAIRLNDRYVAFEDVNLSSLEPDNYEREFLAGVMKAAQVSVEEVIRGQDLPDAVRVSYETLSEGPNSFEELARRLGVMDNIKARVPRTAYLGIVTLWRGHTKVYVVPSTKMY